MTARHSNIPSPRARRAVSPHGFVMLEALVAALIFSIGVLGLVSLQASMTRSQTISKYRGDAIYLADELIGLLWSDLPRVTNYTTANCAAYPRCNDWLSKVGRTLPAAAPAVAASGATYTITIQWTTQSATQNYTTSTAIQP